MSNGYSGHGSVAAEIEQDGASAEGRLIVTSCWSSSGNWIELTWRCEGDRPAKAIIALDKGNDEAVALVANLLEAIDEEEMASALLERSRKLADRQAVRQQADEEFRSAVDMARENFLAATAEQRAAHDNALDRIEQKYHQTTGERLVTSRSVSWGPSPFEQPWELAD